MPDQIDTWVDRDALLEHHARETIETGEEAIDQEDGVPRTGMPAEKQQRPVGLQGASCFGGLLRGDVDVKQRQPAAGKAVDEPDQRRSR